MLKNFGGGNEEDYLLPRPPENPPWKEGAALKPLWKEGAEKPPCGVKLLAFGE